MRQTNDIVEIALKVRMRQRIYVGDIATVRGKCHTVEDGVYEPVHLHLSCLFEAAPSGRACLCKRAFLRLCS